MGKDIFIFAAGAVLTALAVKYATAALLWDIIFWVGVSAMVFSAANAGLRKKKATTGWRLGTYATLGIAIIALIVWTNWSRGVDINVVTSPVLASDAPSWLKVAYGERGQAEIPGPEENPRIVEYFASIGAKNNYQDDVDDWASAFVEWSLNKVGIFGPKKDEPFAWLHWGQKLDQPRTGCIVVLSFRGLHHVGFYFGSEEQDILVLGGNENDAVNIYHYPRSDVVGYRWPPDR